MVALTLIAVVKPLTTPLSSQVGYTGKRTSVALSFIFTVLLNLNIMLMQHSACDPVA